MMHKQRRHRIRAVETLEELCELLVEHDWCCCDGFSHAHLVLVNDATSADGAQEYAVFRTDYPNRQIESVTVSWCSQEYLMEILRGLMDGTRGINMGEVMRRPHEDGTCMHCA